MIKLRESDIKKIKAMIRHRVWKLMEEKNIATFPRPVFHRIPNFVGAEIAAKNLAKLNVFRKASVIKVNPDAPQKPVRYLALTMGKSVVMPTPRLRHGFILLDPNTIPSSKYSEAAAIHGAFKYGKIVKPWDLPSIDLVVVGSVAVNMQGARLGKGEGFAELEYAILRTLCKVTRDTPVVTTVHDIQIVNEPIPVEEHDVCVDIIVTPTKVHYVTPRPPKPSGILWNKIPQERISEMPVLSEVKKFLESNKAYVCYSS